MGDVFLTNIQSRIPTLLEISEDLFDPSALLHHGMDASELIRGDPFIGACALAGPYTPYHSCCLPNSEPLVTELVLFFFL